MSFWKWDGIKATIMYFTAGQNDTDRLIAYDTTGDRFVKSSSNSYDTNFATTVVNFTCKLKTKFHSYGIPNQKKLFKRVKFDLSRSGLWTLNMYADNDERNTGVEFYSGTGTGHYYGDVSIPYDMDGYNLSYELTNTTSNDVEVYGFSTEMERREF
jgi:hypothetical protein